MPLTLYNKFKGCANHCSSSTTHKILSASPSAPPLSVAIVHGSGWLFQSIFSRIMP